MLVTGYLDGAVFTHWRIGDPWYFPMTLRVLAWLGLAFRHSIIFSLAQIARWRRMAQSP